MFFCLLFIFFCVIFSTSYRNKGMDYQDNIKTGDIMITAVGSAVFIRQTRARWYYLYKSRVSSVSKVNLWRMIDLGEVEISYVKDKKYRTKQRKMRTLDLRKDMSVDQQYSRFESFVKFVKTPFDIMFRTSDSRCSIDVGFFVEKLEQKGLKYKVTGNLIKVFE